MAQELQEDAQQERPQRRGRARRHEEHSAPVEIEDRAVRPGFTGGRYRPLDERQVKLIHETALKLLDEVGLASPIPSMIERVEAAGGRLTERGRLLFPRALVEDVIAGARREVTIHGRRPGLEIEISDRRVFCGSGGASPNLVDLEDGCYREATLRDLYDAARLVDCLDNIHFFNRSLVARDVADPREFDLNTLYAIVSGTAKPTGSSFSHPDHVADGIALLDLVAGGDGQYRKRPFCTLLSCHVVPPLRFAEEACAALEAGVRAGMPVMLVAAGQAGATSPAPLAGSVAQSVAEVLAGLVFVYLIDPEVQCIIAPKPLVSDLRTGAMSGGSGEQAVLMAACGPDGQRYYDLPSTGHCGRHGGLQEFRTPNQAFEKGYYVKSLPPTPAPT